MLINKSKVPNTSIYNQLNNHLWNIRSRVDDQMDRRLSIKGWAMILDEVYSATPESLNADCIADIMKLL